MSVFVHRLWDDADFFQTPQQRDQAWFQHTRWVNGKHKSEALWRTWLKSLNRSKTCLKITGYKSSPGFPLNHHSVMWSGDTGKNLRHLQTSAFSVWGAAVSWGADWTENDPKNLHQADRSIYCVTSLDGQTKRRRLRFHSFTSISWF